MMQIPKINVKVHFGNNVTTAVMRPGEEKRVQHAIDPPMPIAVRTRFHLDNTGAVLKYDISEDDIYNGVDEGGETGMNYVTAMQAGATVKVGCTLYDENGFTFEAEPATVTII